MIQKDYLLLLARHNAWQNSQLKRKVQAMSAAELSEERGAFFGSIMGTLNHILWADTLWMSRFCSDVPQPDTTLEDSPRFTETAGVWDAERFRMDGRIRIWAQTISNMDLRESLSWYSVAAEQHFTKPVGLCVTHMFNHQTHHRGQISQMLSAAGIAPPVSDLVLMPEDA
ncbi:DinB family protein [Sulfitobacter sp. HNIBRBA2951]|uniref:DinB family protein n=1 Tax=Sulfitobacter aquimarinus TaxID=3158557 RepID=UPI0032DE768C